MSGSPIGIYLRALGMGAVAGLRSLTAPALFSYMATKRNDGALVRTPLGGLASPKVAGTLCVLAVGELIADKLPQAPNRTIPASVLVRAVSGGVIGAAVCAEEKQPAWPGAVLGAVGAIAATYAAYHLRQATDRKSGLPDPVVALVEDAIAIASGLGVLSHSSR
jgi:uncharacterized membrane protein